MDNYLIKIPSTSTCKATTYGRLKFFFLPTKFYSTGLLINFILLDFQTHGRFNDSSL